MPSIPPGKLSLQPVDLTNCDREQIHIPDAVQSFGALIAFDGHQKITRVSANIKQVIPGMETNALLGKALSEVLPEESLKRLLASNGLSGWHVNLAQLKNGSPVEMLLHDSGQEKFIDIVARQENQDHLDHAAILMDFIAKSSKADSVLALSQLLADVVRKISNFDRVKIYQFDADWNGAVIAESRVESAPTYLGLHFPHTDIPKQARELYQRNKVRVIADVDDVKAPVVSSGERPPLDLSFSFIRSVSEIHLQYLRNMKVRASMSLSLFNGNKFWGLVACHNYSS